MRKNEKYIIKLIKDIEQKLNTPVRSSARPPAQYSRFFFDRVVGGRKKIITRGKREHSNQRDPSVEFLKRTLLWGITLCSGQPARKQRSKSCDNWKRTLRKISSPWNFVELVSNTRKPVSKSFAQKLKLLSWPLFSNKIQQNAHQRQNHPSLTFVISWKRRR